MHLADGLGHEREHPPRAGVEQQRLVAVDQVLVEGEAAGGDLGDAGREAVDAVGDLVDGGLHAVIVAPAIRRAHRGRHPRLARRSHPVCRPCTRASSASAARSAAPVRVEQAGDVPLDGLRRQVELARRSPGSTGPSATSLSTSTSRLVTPERPQRRRHVRVAPAAAGHRRARRAEHRAAAAGRAVVAARGEERLRLAQPAHRVAPAVAQRGPRDEQLLHVHGRVAVPQAPQRRADVGHERGRARRGRRCGPGRRPRWLGTASPNWAIPMRPTAPAFSARWATPRSSSSIACRVAHSTRPGYTDVVGGAARTYSIIVSRWPGSASRSPATNARVTSTRPYRSPRIRGSSGSWASAVRDGRGHRGVVARERVRAGEPEVRDGLGGQPVPAAGLDAGPGGGEARLAVEGHQRDVGEAEVHHRDGESAP